ncbi:alpha/beta fold hydrolase [Jannaschia sp. S6380]|uniref:alpha/beta fold hydrolase BchO n=1 Tax=Jannaschia sp. S6380 TaxID=2926408 RepID=UPI001FF2F92A|nr:alpha/beta fold hydrolase BchO [Jannaschia sp. S6380]MCK0167691.1 alpha/beta fold hydrolase [Jannaschia sp. S6380]
MAEHSRIVAMPPHRWHVQEAGTGPTALLIHGAGGASQSWRGLFPILSRHFRAIAIDLPGQGFTRLGARHRCGLDDMTHDLARLCDAEGWRPDLLIGHSAGGAIALRLAELAPDTPKGPKGIVGINPALGNFRGAAGWLFPLMAKLLSLAPFTADLFVATSSSPRNVRRLIEGTGSRLDARGLDLYARLAGDRVHVDATLAMMAQWTLDPLLARLDRIATPTLFLLGEEDRAVPPEIGARAAARMPHATARHLPDLGHLAHEEDPDLVGGIIRDWWDGLT